MISYNAFWDTLRNRKMSTYMLIEKYNISPNTLTRMRNNEYLSLRTIDDLCKILNCKIQDIAEYIPDTKEDQ